jgi:hypothetical protein
MNVLLLAQVLTSNTSRRLIVMEKVNESSGPALVHPSLAGYKVSILCNSELDLETISNPPPPESDINRPWEHCQC